MAQVSSGARRKAWGVETPPAVAGAREEPRGSNLPPYHNATRYHQAPTSHQPPLAATRARPGSIAHHLLQDQGGSDRGHVAGKRLRRGATSVEDYSSICGWADPQRNLYASFLNKVQQRIRRAARESNVQATLNHGAIGTFVVGL
ncbi:hypothetical protein GWK47_012723 [Chionoecetes opilio]|uniref:Uncharacterized protein n=1 Tax=Chionoecetes opilio TaxID=41210 RepID=A0A8J4XUW7_CHIOP|nr:hypothetical protein GWK47_012723 [Chionoecetes opilio]